MPVWSHLRSSERLLIFAAIMKTITVVAAVIRNSRGEIFVTQRGYGEFKDWWELPGGKAEPGETMEQALKNNHFLPTANKFCRWCDFINTPKCMR